MTQTPAILTPKNLKSRKNKCKWEETLMVSSSLVTSTLTEKRKLRELPDSRQNLIVMSIANSSKPMQRAAIKVVAHQTLQSLRTNRSTWYFLKRLLV